MSATLLLDGRRFRLTVATLAIETIEDQRTIVLIPIGDVIQVLEPSGNDQRMVDAVWNNRTVVMFAVDIVLRGEEVRSAGSGR